MMVLIRYNGETVYPTANTVLRAGNVLIVLVRLADEGAVRDVLVRLVAWEIWERDS